FGFGQQITREEIICGPTFRACLSFNPQKIFDACRPAAGFAGSHVKGADFPFQIGDNLVRVLFEGIKIKGCKRLPDDPEGHGIYVGADNAESQAVGLNDGSSASHKRVRNDSGELVGTPVIFLKRILAVEFRKQKVSKHRAGTTREPLVDPDYRPIVLLDLILFLCQRGGKCNVEARLKRTTGLHLGSLGIVLALWINDSGLSHLVPGSCPEMLSGALPKSTA
ncbi:MAG: hypothetical protein LLG06_18460, partial [Desulfobacteraceae bacterium]|nr:hypothetical protein [Desulfobacteraceae bacterium]